MERIIAAESTKPNTSRKSIVDAIYSDIVMLRTADLAAIEKDKVLWLDSLSLPGDEPYAALELRESAPRGRLMHSEAQSAIYPNTKHRFSLYLPEGAEAEKEYPLTVFLDGESIFLSSLMRTASVLDALIAESKLPPMAALFLESGNNGEGMPCYNGAYMQPGSSRSLEYDSVDDTFTKLLESEILPELGKYCRISPSPEDRCIIGAGSGGLAAVNTAWFRPDIFGKAGSFIGSFIDIRGGNSVPIRTRMNKARPVRVFLQDGEKDLNIWHGNWVIGNRQMASALDFRGYDYRFVMGVGGHTLFHAASILPEALCWLWRE